MSLTEGSVGKEGLYKNLLYLEPSGAPSVVRMFLPKLKAGSKRKSGWQGSLSKFLDSSIRIGGALWYHFAQVHYFTTWGGNWGSEGNEVNGRYKVRAEVSSPLTRWSTVPNFPKCGTSGVNIGQAEGEAGWVGYSDSYFWLSTAS